MAQVQKDEQREKILESAKAEFASNGIPKSSMRIIAKNAGTTVGNVYRYYKNKQEIVQAVLSPALKQLDYFEKLYVGVNEDAKLSEITPAMLDEFIDTWVDTLVDVQSLFPVEMYIILNDDQINEEYQSGLNDLITSVLLETKSQMVGGDNGAELVAGILAKSVFSGIREGVSLKYNIEVTSEDFAVIMKKYMKHAFSLFLSDRGV